jgi:hypothetical protein
MSQIGTSKRTTVWIATFPYLLKRKTNGWICKGPGGNGPRTGLIAPLHLFVLSG